MLSPIQLRLRAGVVHEVARAEPSIVGGIWEVDPAIAIVHSVVAIHLLVYQPPLMATSCDLTGGLGQKDKKLES